MAKKAELKWAPYGDRPAEIGDVVRLASGGPDMTVSHLVQDGLDACWFDANDACHFQRFTAAMLVVRG